MRLTRFVGVALLAAHASAFVCGAPRGALALSVRFAADPNPDDDPPDVVEVIGGWMGYPSEQKWKGIRMAIYAFAAGSMLRSAVGDLGDYLERPSVLEDSVLLRYDGKK